MTKANHVLHVHVPVVGQSTLNLREHHMTRYRRLKKHRESAHWALKAYKPMLPCIVIVTRIGAKLLDKHDNLPASAKGVVDGIADWLQVKDDDKRIDWRYEQRIGPPGFEVTVMTEIEIA